MMLAFYVLLLVVVFHFVKKTFNNSSVVLARYKMLSSNKILINYLSTMLKIKNSNQLDM